MATASRLVDATTHQAAHLSAAVDSWLTTTFAPDFESRASRFAEQPDRPDPGRLEAGMRT